MQRTLAVTMNLQDSALAGPDAASVNRLLIRGRTLDLAGLVDWQMFSDKRVDEMAAKMQSATPFPHLELKDWVDPVLLELVAEEFELGGHNHWRDIQTKYEATRRSLVGAQLGPASQLYFGIVNSGEFVRLLARLSGVEGLVADGDLYGGGLHETRTGGSFGIHRDFDRHPRTGLRNELVVLTYLNHGWRPEWNGALELWDHRAKRAVAIFEPNFGRTVVMSHGPAHYHGHPRPMAAPPHVRRRSVATYYYSNPHRVRDVSARTSSVYLAPDCRDSIRQTLVRWFGQRTWQALRRVSGRGRANNLGDDAYRLTDHHDDRS